MESKETEDAILKAHKLFLDSIIAIKGKIIMFTAILPENEADNVSGGIIMLTGGIDHKFVAEFVNLVNESVQHANLADALKKVQKNDMKKQGIILPISYKGGDA